MPSAKKLATSLGLVMGMCMMGGDGAGWPWVNFTGFLVFATSIYFMSRPGGAQ